MRCILLLLLLSFALPAMAHADLDDFREEVEEAEKEKPPEESRTEDEEDDEEEGESLLGRFLWELFGAIWLVNNTTTTYGSHPYSADGYIRWARVEEGYGADGEVYIPTGRRSHWLYSEIQALALEGLGQGTWFTLKGHAYRFFGPYFEGWVLGDGEDLFGGLRLGLTFSLFQSDPLSLSLYGQGNMWFGVLARSGGALGVELRSYPFKPLSLQLRGGLQLFERFSVGEVESRAGLLFGRWEAYAGLRWWRLLDGAGLVRERYSGPFAGAGCHY